jgi:cellulose synthase/poly-beta-1,6-N-acetylglucosamine synthase-like glycosyltransferase
LISIIVPAFDAAESIGACLDALALQGGLDALSDALSDMPGGAMDSEIVDGKVVEWEVIVVDDGSRDATAAIVEAHPLGVRLLRQAHRGAAAARNRGVAAARGQLLLFTDADCRPRPDWALEMARPLVMPGGPSGSKGLFETDQRSLLARFAQAEYEEKERRMLGRASVPFADTAAAAYRASVFREFGGFRSDLGAVEDTELAFRLAAAGHRIVVAPAARVLHQHPERLRDYLGRKWRYGRWGAQAYLAHPARMAEDGRTPVAMRLQLILLPLILAAAVAAVLPAAIRPAMARPLLALLCLGFVLSCLPFIRGAKGHGLTLRLLSLPLFGLRALALDAGLALGLLERCFRPSHSRLPLQQPQGPTAPKR